MRCKLVVRDVTHLYWQMLFVKQNFANVWRNFTACQSKINFFPLIELTFSKTVFKYQYTTQKQRMLGAGNVCLEKCLSFLSPFHLRSGCNSTTDLGLYCADDDGARESITNIIDRHLWTGAPFKTNNSSIKTSMNIARSRSANQ